MVMLGDLLSAASRDDTALARWLATNEPRLAAQVEDAAGDAGETLGGYARAAMAAFERRASEEDWVSATAGARQAGDPGLAFIARVVAWRLSAEGAAASDDRKG